VNRTHGFTTDELRTALRQLAVCFPVYRSYVTASGYSAEDRRMIDKAVAAASRGQRHSVYRFLKHALKGEVRRGGRMLRTRAAVKAALSFQQFSAPVMAKGMEDTAFYRYRRLLSLNEVGGDPRRFGGGPRASYVQMA